jgi:hypothetical protein
MGGDVSPPRRTGRSDVLSEFVDAVHALSGDAGPKNVDRYLTASRAVERTRHRNSPRSRVRDVRES